MRVTPPSARDLDGQHIAVFLDIDGTLLEHRPHPEDVHVDDRLRGLIGAVARSLDGAVAFVTGRNVAMVDRLFAPLHLPTAGLYGLEHRLTPDGTVERADEPEDLTSVADQLQHRFRSTEGIYFERKGAVLAVHTRAAPAAFPQIKAAAEEALSRLPEGYRIVAGHAGLEFMPLEALKSAAIERFMDTRPFSGRIPVFLGDDVSDEAGFEYVNARSGISIRVRPQAATEAKFALPDVASVHEWLAGFGARDEVAIRRDGFTGADIRG